MSSIYFLDNYCKKFLFKNIRETNHDTLFKYLNLCILFKCLVPWINDRETNHDTLFNI